MSELTKAIASFADARDWTQFHTPRNLLLALTGEVGELSEIFQWVPDTEVSAEWVQEHHSAISGELADVFIYLIRLSQVLGIDLIQAAAVKLVQNEDRYPVDLARGNAKKYTRLGE